MAQQVRNPFEDEKPQLVHLEKSESHYEACRMQMHDIERTHRRTFLCNTGLCILVCLLSVFHIYISGFGFFSKPFLTVDSPGSILAGGIFQIILAMIVILLGYLAWANFRTMNIVLAIWYLAVTVGGIAGGDYVSAIIGVLGLVFYVFSIREMRHEEQLSQIDGYPDFQEKFDLSKSDIVIQTLLAHQGEHRTKSTLFTTDYSLRRKKKSSPAPFGFGGTEEDSGKENGAAGKALAEELKRLSDTKKHADAAPADEAAETHDMPDVTEEAAPTPSAEPAADAQAARSAEAIIAEAEAKAKAILADALAQAEALRAADSSAAQPSAPSGQSAQNPQAQQNPQNKQRKKKKH